MMDNTTTERNSMDSTTKKIPLFNVPQKFKDLLKKFEYVEEPIVREQSSQQSTPETEKKKSGEKNDEVAYHSCFLKRASTTTSEASPNSTLF